MRKNKKRSYRVDGNVTLGQPRINKGAQAYEDWHWGVQPQQVIDWGDNDFPPMLIECGRLVRLHVRSPEGARSNRIHPRRKRDSMIEFSKNVSTNSHVAYDPDHPDERLYLLVDPAASKTLAKRFWNDNGMASMPLAHLASIAGGKHGKRRDDYPQVMVKPVGVLTALVYYTHKKGDENPGNDRSYYIHQMGELSKHFPFLAVDAHGRLWLAGGNYTCPSPGITD